MNKRRRKKKKKGRRGKRESLTIIPKVLPVSEEGGNREGRGEGKDQKLPRERL